MQLHIEKLVHGGLGLARTGTGVCFVENVLPGEIVNAEVFGRKGGIPVASVSSFIKTSTKRKKPQCPDDGICGGCDWQYIKYSEQTKLKRDIFIDCLERIGKLSNLPEIEMIGSPEWEYRIRAQIKVDFEKHCAGFYKRRTNDVIQIRHCPLLDKGINNFLYNQEIIFSSISNKLVNQVKVISGMDNTVASAPVIGHLTEHFTCINAGNKTFTLTGDSFFQGNKYLLEKIGIWAESFVSGNFFIDMYGGVGFFSVMLGHCFSEGLLVESIEKQTQLAEKNFNQNGITHIKTLTTTAENFFSNKFKSIPKINCLIIDPPRTGLTQQVREGIHECMPDTILYISCNPSTQARDVGFFIKECGYTINKAALFDLFPQTHHLETALLLQYK